MPWVSEKQRRWGNSPAGLKAIGPAGVKEFNKASKGKSLPQRVGKKKESKRFPFGKAR